MGRLCMNKLKCWAPNAHMPSNSYPPAAADHNPSLSPPSHTGGRVRLHGVPQSMHTLHLLRPTPRMAT